MKALLTSIFSILLAITAIAETIQVTGLYQGKDVYVQNSYASDGVGFCVFEVVVNGEVASDEINSSAFAVDLAVYSFDMGDPVDIIIRFKSDCEIRVINPQALQPKTTCAYTFTGVDMEGTELKWKTEGEQGPLPFVVEQFRWNKWIRLGDVIGEGRPGVQNYAYTIDTQHGENKYRIRQSDTKIHNFSDIVLVVDETTPEVTILKTKVKEEIQFSRETDYEIYSEYGDLKAVGTGVSVPVADFRKGAYILNYGNKFGETIQKK